ncbi:MAG: tryptophan--tRNA ligase [Actinobacteria bacterium]|jgi:tryptophanyl-tRNA synthetase|uniref:tryptophan--tRNA ligase n=1 Tax=freshwater metagenome TaxID=449393 RepID=A0A6J5ZAI0_9ZZZZ|nr:tryptophan--tRNA ligase [Actinomycetota bacterium]MSY15520.1 tryptophan--tRNA ligase [Actinomycetota bacterium]MSZ53829.1 tryptophan--tRNA ligase [Actinomycetota bacterium]MTA79645.1 tryptophan--tRNA ligase [Actinomycetota bacterium]
MSKKRVLSGIQPTHDSFHLGNYLGALKQWVDLQQSHDAFYCVVDLHALTVETDPKLLEKRTLVSAAQLIAIGVDPKLCTLFIQSHVPAHNQLAWVLECLTGFGEAGRMTQFKDKSQKGGADRTNVGLFTYPILQAADILLYQANNVPVGEDQRQHIELTRDLGQRFNTKYKNVFTIPEAHIIKAMAKINDLQEPTAKMSKSANTMAGVIELLDTPEATMKKFKSSVTDAGREVKFDTAEKAGISNLLTIHSALSGKSISDLENEFAGKGYGDFKVAVAEVVIATLDPIRKRTEELMNDKGELLKILKSGADKANEVAGKTLADVYSALGLIAHG